MPTKISILKEEINEVKLLLEGIAVYSEVPEPIIDLTISKVNRLKEILLDLKKKDQSIESPLTETNILDQEKKEESITRPKDQLEEHPLEEVEEIQELSSPEENKTLKEPEAKTAGPPPIAKKDEVITEEKAVKTPDVERTQNPSRANEDLNPISAFFPKETPDVKLEDEPATQIDKVNVTISRKKILGETLIQEKTVMNDVVGEHKNTVAQNVVQKPISNLKSAIPINDRFKFQRDLFGNDVSLFNKTLEEINSFSTFNDAANYISTNFEWDKSHSTTTDFMTLLQRRFAN